MNASPTAAAPADQRNAPPALWAAGAILVLVGLALLRVAIIGGWAYLPEAADTGYGALARGFVLLAIGLAGCGLGLILIAYRLLHGDRVARAALFLTAAAVAVAAIGGAEPTFGLVPDDPRIRRWLFGGSVLVAGLAGVLRSSRRFFRGPGSADGDRPASLVVGQLLLAITGLSVGMIAAVAALFGVVNAGWYVLAVLLAGLAGAEFRAYRQLARAEPVGRRSATIASGVVIALQTILIGRPTYLAAVGSQVAVILLVRRESVRRFLSSAPVDSD
jgi:hypothetical protein